MIIFENSVPVEIDDDDPRAVAILQLRALAFSQADAQKAEDVRQDRNSRLQETDKWVIKSVETGIPLTESQLTYRQSLRDLPAQEGFPNSVVWPPKPEV